MPIQDDIHPINPERLQAITERLFPGSSSVHQMLNGISSEDAAALFFYILQNPSHVTNISKAMVDAGYAQRNLAILGKTGKEGDRIVLSRWPKAASGSAIIATRYNLQGELQVLVGKKIPPAQQPFWALPGGHHELDEHDNLEHTLVAELMEETGIIPLADEFMPYIQDTLAHAGEKLPYRSIQDAPAELVSNDLTWQLITVISGEKAHHEKRCINVAYRVHFNDGDLLQPRGSDDLGELKWFSLSQMRMFSEDPAVTFHEDILTLDTMRFGQGLMIETMMRSIHAWSLCMQLIRSGKIEDIEYYIRYLQRLTLYSEAIESAYRIRKGRILAEYMVGPRQNEYITRALALHGIRQYLERDLYKLKPGDGSALSALIERSIIHPFVTKNDYLP
jgi:8-oxo-dGTP pyrophosphatase MutT (NUDIX family)